MKKIKFIIALSGLLIFSSALWAESTTDAAKREKFIEAAKSYLGTKYVWGGTSRSGIDCSGFVYCSARDAGLGSIPRTAQLIHDASTRIPYSSLSKGDLVFFTENGRTVSHVAIWMGDQFQIIHAASSGSKTGVIISKLQGDNYWTKHTFDYGRIIGSGTEVAALPVETKSLLKSNISAPVFNKRKRAKKEWPVAVEFDGFIDWTLFDLESNNKFKTQFDITGAGLDAQFRTNLFEYDPGILVKMFCSKNSSTLEVPVCLAFNKKYYSFYGGVSFPLYFDKDDKTVRGFDFKLDDKKSYNYIGGIQLQTPQLKIGNANYSLVQDISLTKYNLAEDQSKLSINEIFSNGLRFQTGIKVTLK